jgi:hypothetical protein
MNIKTLSNTSLVASLSINDIRDLDMHRNNGITNLFESHQLLGGGYINGSVDIISGYGMLALQNYLS